MATLLLVGAVSAWRLVSVQVLGAERYVQWGADQRVRTVEIAAARGSLLDRDRNALVLSDDRPTIYTDPAFVEDPAATAAALSTVLGIAEAELVAILTDDSRFRYLARQVDAEVGVVVSQLGLPGVFVIDEPARLHPNGDDFARGLLGRVDVDHRALTGLERQYDDVLAGTSGWETFERGRDGTELPAGATAGEAATRGDDVVLTIHRETQFLAEQVLVEQVEAQNASGGYAVIMRTGTGEILAAAGVSLDRETGIARPAAYNMAFLDTYEPGSVNKVFTISAALENGVVTPDTVFDVPQRYEFADKEFEEPFSTGIGRLAVHEILAKSSNIGTIRIAELLGKDRLYDHLLALGFGRRTGPNGTPAVPDESPGILVPASEWFGTELAAIAFGQALAVTPVQIAGAYNAIANDGVYVRPTLLRGVIDAEGALHRTPPARGVRAMSSTTATQITEMLSEVVSDGTGVLAAVDGYEVAGKTGTAQKPFEGGYSETDYMSTFAGFVPADDPELTIVVILDTAETYLAGEVAAPLFSELAGYALRTLRVPPTDPVAPSSDAPTDESGDAGATG